MMIYNARTISARSISVKSSSFRTGSGCEKIIAFLSRDTDSMNGLNWIILRMSEGIFSIGMSRFENNSRLEDMSAEASMVIDSERKITPIRAPNSTKKAATRMQMASVVHRFVTIVLKKNAKAMLSIMIIWTLTRLRFVRKSAIKKTILWVGDTELRNCAGELCSTTNTIAARKMPANIIDMAISVGKTKSRLEL